MRNLKVVGRALLDIYENMFILLAVNGVWFLLASVPASFLLSLILSPAEGPEAAPEVLSALPVLLVLAALLFALLTSPASYALAVMMRRVTDLEAVTVREFFGLMVRHARRAWLMGFFSTGVTALLLTNIRFYGGGALGAWGAVLLPFFLMLTVIWLLMQLFYFPLAVITEGGPLRVLRNSAIVVLRHPGLSLTIGLAAAILIGLSSALVIPWLILTMGGVTALGTRAVRVAVRRDLGLPDEEPLIDEPLPPILGDESGRPTQPRYGMQSARREAEQPSEGRVTSDE